jgi:hypothetical protein
MARLAFYGDLQLGSELRAIVPSQARGNLQVHQGGDRLRALVTAASPNLTTALDVQTFIAPDSTFSKKGFRSYEMAMRGALTSRANRTDPVMWIETSTPTRTVGSFASPTVTCNGHGLSNGNVVLIRRSGVGYYTLSTISGVTTNTFVVVSLSSSHTITAGDNIYLVEQAYYGCVWQDLAEMQPAPNGDYYCEMASFKFLASGSTTYSATTTTLP